MCGDGEDGRLGVVHVRWVRLPTAAVQVEEHREQLSISVQQPTSPSREVLVGAHALDLGRQRVDNQRVNTRTAGACDSLSLGRQLLRQSDCRLS